MHATASNEPVGVAGVRSQPNPRRPLQGVEVRSAQMDSPYHARIANAELRAMPIRRLVALTLACSAAAFCCPAAAESAYSLRPSGNRLIGFSTSAPETLSLDLPITGVNVGESLVALDVRPQNGLLYGLGIDPTANSASLYAISTRTGFAGLVGTPGAIAFVDAAGNPIDFPDPAVVGYGMDFNPAVDRLRVVAGGLNFRIDANAGTPIDGNFGGGAIAGINPDGPISGATTTVSATAYSNDQPNTTVTTQYTLDDSSNTLYIQNPPNTGTQTAGQTLVIGASVVDFTAVNGFDIPAFVNAPASNAPASGSAFAALTVGGNNAVFRIDLVNGQSVALGSIGAGNVASHGLALKQSLPGVAMIGLTQDGLSLVRFNSASSTTQVTLPISGLGVGEVLVGIDWRPHNGQLFGLGINAAANTGTLYRIDPQGGAGNAPVTPIGGTQLVALVDAAGNPVDLPDPFTTDYGVDFNPSVDRVRVTTSGGLNFRVNPNTGAPVDGDAVLAGVNPDGAIQGSGSTGVSGAAYTNNFGKPLDGSGATTLYTLDAAQNRLFIQNPANIGTQTQGSTILLDGSTLDFSNAAGFDIAADVGVTTSGTRATGQGYAVLTVGGLPGVYSIDLFDGAARFLGAVPVALRGLTVAEPTSDIFRDGFE
jgi:hypothetical protein